MWILAVYVTDRIRLRPEWTQEYEQLHHAQAKAKYMIRHGFGKKDGDVYLYYPAHKVDYVAIRPADNLTNPAE